MKKHIKKWRVTAEINMDALRYITVVVKANTARKARILAEEKMKRECTFYVTNMTVKEIVE